MAKHGAGQPSKVDIRARSRAHMNLTQLQPSHCGCVLVNAAELETRLADDVRNLVI